MTAFNVVRFKVKPGLNEEFVEAHKAFDRDFPGFRRAVLVNTGDRNYCFIGEWDDYDSIVQSRNRMIGNLDSVRDLLEDLGSGLGVTDPISGEAVLDF